MEVTGKDGAYFEKETINSEKWLALQKKVATQGMRNAYLLAVAPTSSTSIISGTTAGLDPILKRYFLEEKKAVCSRESHRNCHRLLTGITKTPI